MKLLVILEVVSLVLVKLAMICLSALAIVFCSVFSLDCIDLMIQNRRSRQARRNLRACA